MDLENHLHQSMQTLNLCCMPSVSHNHHVVCVACMNGWSLNVHFFSYKILRPSEASSPPQLHMKTPFILNTFFCPSSLLASAGAHQVVIFYKVCIDIQAWGAEMFTILL